MGRPKGSKNRTYKRIVSHGYILVWNPKHREAMKNGYVRQHRMIMSDMIGRKLRRGEEVHHRDGNKQNNRTENLQLLSKIEHSALTWTGRARGVWSDERRAAKSRQMMGNQNWRGKAA